MSPEEIHHLLHPQAREALSHFSTLLEMVGVGGSLNLLDDGRDINSREDFRNFWHNRLGWISEQIGKLSEVDPIL